MIDDITKRVYLDRMDEQATVMRLAVEEAVRRLEGPTSAAEACGEKQSTVSMWLARGRVSHTGVVALAARSGVSVHRLRPDIFGPENQVADHPAGNPPPPPMTAADRPAAGGA